jgi:hypothetical protein
MGEAALFQRRELIEAGGNEQDAGNCRLAHQRHAGHGAGSLKRPLKGHGKEAEKTPQSEITESESGDAGGCVLHLTNALRLAHHAPVEQHHG